MHQSMLFPTFAVDITEVAMPFRPPFFDNVAEALNPVLHDLPGKIVSIDGADGSGKTTLGRFLAWYFNVTLLESDNFILEGKGLIYDVDTVRALIRRRLKKPRPILIEGVVVLRLLSEVGYQSDFHIHLQKDSGSSSEFLADALEQYQREFRPSERAHLIITTTYD
ncbi:hypothetical protein ACLBKS_07175 [Hylemonella sp. W303a]|uniref:hypothetical protein n=1 Tax=Hylemonella sp. W303a TaxID=3389873 RepID=UPI00396B1C16